MFGNGGLGLLEPVLELRREMDRLFENVGRDYRAPAGRLQALFTPAYPAVNVWDCGEALCLEAEIPGVDEKTLEVFAVGSELTIKGRREPLAGDNQNRVCHRQERPVGEFSRVISLPAEVDAQKVEATLQNGVLTVRMPKSESAKPRRITVKAS